MTIWTPANGVQPSSSVIVPTASTPSSSDNGAATVTTTDPNVTQMRARSSNDGLEISNPGVI